MTWLLAAGVSWLGGAALVWLLRRLRIVTALSVLATLSGAGCLLAAALGALGGGRETLDFSWSVPFGDLALRLDPLAGVFLVPIAVVGSAGALYAPGYLRLRHAGAPIGSWLAVFLVLLSSMVLVVVAAHTVLLLAAWEIMTIASWYLLATHHEEREVRAAGIGYLVAGHVSGAALLLFFVFLAVGGTWMIPAAPLAPAPGLPPAGLLFALALIGFGTKAAVVPLHVWLPDAHASAPSPVSALMSGVLITLGFYGLARFLPVTGLAPATSGLVLMALGTLGAVGGIVMALSQRDVKRILAYSTIENAGLMTLAIGAAFVASAAARPAVGALAWTAALLHIWNHAVSKSLLFLAAGAVAELAGSRDLERWGGLLRRLPILGTTLLVGAGALIGLPGTHGFASEWLLFLGLFQGSQELTGALRLAMFGGVVALAFTAGTALVCFVRLVGIGLLGHPRSAAAAGAVEPRNLFLAIPVAVLAGLCLALAALIGPLLALLARAVEDLAPGAEVTVIAGLAAPLPWLAALLLGGAGLVFLHRVWVRRRRDVRRAVTWDCGYARPAPTMQYTATSLVEPITRVLKPALHTAVDWTPPRSLWPPALTWEARTPERTLVDLYRPAYVRLAQALGYFTRLQEGRVMVYLRYVGIALFVLLLWLFLPVGAPR
jgi:formate hydrogenlyase subunit 3/multisubunit Na+/H+ antiporter MnhD subunit